MNKILPIFLVFVLGCGFGEESTSHVEKDVIETNSFEQIEYDSSDENTRLKRTATSYNSDEIITLKENLTSYDSTVIKFYKWYLDNYYNGKDEIFEPRAVLNKNGIYQLDTSRYNQILRESNFFSIEYFQVENEKYALCNSDLVNIDTAEVTECGCNPADLLESRNCNMTYSLRWLFHQGEITNDVKIISSELKNGRARVKVCLFNNEEDPIFCETTVNVTLSQHSTGWKIDSIESNFKSNN